MDKKKSYFDDGEAAMFSFEQTARHAFAIIETLERLAASMDLDPKISNRSLALLQSSDCWLTVIPGMVARIRAAIENAIDQRITSAEERRVNFEILQTISKETREL